MKKLKPFISIPPGEFIKEELEERGWSQDDLAKVLGLSLKSVNKIINGKQQITIDTARLLSDAFGQSPQYWLNLDTNYRLRTQPKKKEKSEVTIKSIIYTYMPINEMIKKNWIKPFNTVDFLEKQVFKFWQINELNFDFLEQKAANLHFRKSEAYRQFNIFYALTWFQQARKIAQTQKSDNFNRDELIAITEKINQYTLKDKGISQFIDDLIAAGIRFFILPHLQKTYIDAATFRNHKNPVIVYTARHNRIDNFWFCMAHELAHVLYDLNQPDEYFIDDMDRKPVDQKEERANQFASKLLKHPDIFRFFRTRRKYISEFRVIRCAEKVNVHPAVIVGALQYTGWLSVRNLNKFKEKVKPKIPKKYVIQSG